MAVNLLSFPGCLMNLNDWDLPCEGRTLNSARRCYVLECMVGVKLASLLPSSGHTYFAQLCSAQLSSAASHGSYLLPLHGSESSLSSNPPALLLAFGSHEGSPDWLQSCVG